MLDSRESDAIELIQRPKAELEDWDARSIHFSESIDVSSGHPDQLTLTKARTQFRFLVSLVA